MVKLHISIEISLFANVMGALIRKASVAVLTEFPLDRCTHHLRAAEQAG